MLPAHPPLTAATSALWCSRRCLRIGQSQGSAGFSGPQRLARALLAGAQQHAHVCACWLPRLTGDAVGWLVPEVHTQDHNDRHISDVDTPRPDGERPPPQPPAAGSSASGAPASDTWGGHSGAGTCRPSCLLQPPQPARVHAIKRVSHTHMNSVHQWLCFPPNSPFLCCASCCSSTPSAAAAAADGRTVGHLESLGVCRQGRPTVCAISALQKAGRWAGHVGWPLGHPTWQQGADPRWQRQLAAAARRHPRRACPQTAAARRSPPPACPLCCLSVCKALNVLLRRCCSPPASLILSCCVSAPRVSCRCHKRVGRAGKWTCVRSDMTLSPN